LTSSETPGAPNYYNEGLHPDEYEMLKQKENKNGEPEFIKNLRHKGI
jgi:hypothetical protein